MNETEKLNILLYTIERLNFESNTLYKLPRLIEILLNEFYDYKFMLNDSYKIILDDDDYKIMSDIFNGYNNITGTHNSWPILSMIHNNFAHDPKVIDPMDKLPRVVDHKIIGLRCARCNSMMDNKKLPSSSADTDYVLEIPKAVLGGIASGSSDFESKIVKVDHVSSPPNSSRLGGAVDKFNSRSGAVDSFNSIDDSFTLNCLDQSFHNNTTSGQSFHNNKTSDDSLYSVVDSVCDPTRIDVDKSVCNPNVIDADESTYKLNQSLSANNYFAICSSPNLKESATDLSSSGALLPGSTSLSRRQSSGVNKVIDPVGLVDNLEHIKENLVIDGRGLDKPYILQLNYHDQIICSDTLAFELLKFSSIMVTSISSACRDILKRYKRCVEKFNTDSYYYHCIYERSNECKDVKYNSNSCSNYSGDKLNSFNSCDNCNIDDFIDECNIVLDIDLGRNDSIGDEGVKIIAEMLIDLPIRCLNLYNCGITRIGLLYLIPFLRSRYLEQLNIMENGDASLSKDSNVINYVVDQFHDFERDVIARKLVQINKL